MKTFILFFLLPAFFISCNPIASIHKTYTAQDIVDIDIDQATWKFLEKDDQKLEFIFHKNKYKYDLQIKSSNKEANELLGNEYNCLLDAVFFKLNNKLFMDLSLNVKNIKERGAFIGIHSLPLHTCYEVLVKKDTLKIIDFYSYLGNKIYDNKMKINHIYANKEIIKEEKYIPNKSKKINQDAINNVSRGRIILTDKTKKLQKNIIKYYNKLNKDTLVLIKNN